MRVELYGCELGNVAYGIIVYSECQDALGMENGLISDSQLSASTQWNDLEGAHRGRLHLTEVWDPLHESGGWVSKLNDVNQWLQIDVLGLTRNYVRVTRVSTQGRETTSYGEVYVKAYRLQYSNDGVNFQYYKESGTTNAKEFDGNIDHYSVVHHDLNPPITERYIRFRPLTWNVHISMRVEIYGCTQECTAPAIGIETGSILNAQMTSSTGNASLARLNGRFAWCPLIDGYGEYIQIDLERLYRVCAVATQGFPGGNKHYVKEYELGWSNDQIDWDKSAEVLKGNNNCYNIVKNSVPAIYARYIRLYPIAWYIRGCVRIELYGKPWPEASAASFTPIAPGKALSGHVILSLNNTNVMECFKTCLIAGQCKSFNYNEQLKKCEVSGSSGKEHELTEQDGFYYYELTSR
ncbi:unnamed protein product [Porites evermanni]|uniref:Uncharacterized protein n=1 Tax=Porites evermanni TaxID=104178 RepID=A0ABN8S6W1_9CNID|nr:unnamed protein product [Porites evermanni]